MVLRTFSYGSITNVTETELDTGDRIALKNDPIVHVARLLRCVADPDLLDLNPDRGFSVIPNRDLGFC